MSADVEYPSAWQDDANGSPVPLSAPEWLREDAQVYADIAGDDVEDDRPKILRGIASQIETLLAHLATVEGELAAERARSEERLQTLQEYWRMIVRGGEEKAALRAERDTLRAAIERVRGLDVETYHGPCGGFGCYAPDGDVMRLSDILAALPPCADAAGGGDA